MWLWVVRFEMLCILKHELDCCAVAISGGTFPESEQVFFRTKILQKCLEFPLKGPFPSKFQTSTLNSETEIAWQHGSTGLCGSRTRIGCACFMCIDLCSWASQELMQFARSSSAQSGISWSPRLPLSPSSRYFFLASSKKQFGVGSPAGADSLYCHLTAFSQQHPEEVFLQLDMSNAFGNINRQAVLQAVQRLAPSSPGHSMA